MPKITAEYLASQGLNETFPKRFWRKVIKQESCWKWTGGTNEHGYGIIGTGTRNVAFIKAHRASWVLHNGPIPYGLCVLHKCDNPPCTRPDHLFLGTHKDNGLDAAKKLRCPHDEKHWNAKLSNDQVNELRSLYKRHAKNQKSLALKFGISVITLRQICYGKRRKHLITQAVEPISTNPI